MQTIENSAQFRQEVQEMLRSIEEKINDLSQAGSGQTQSTTEEINRLKNQGRNLQEALERYGNKNGEQWQAVQSKAQYALEEVRNTWLANADSEWKESKGEEQSGKWRVSTGQSDRGASGKQSGLGDRGGMEDRQSGLDNTTQYSSFGNPYDEEEVEEIEQQKPGRRSTEEQSRRDL